MFTFTGFMPGMVFPKDTWVVVDHTDKDMSVMYIYHKDSTTLFVRVED